MWNKLGTNQLKPRFPIPILQVNFSKWSSYSILSLATKLKLTFSKRESIE